MGHLHYLIMDLYYKNVIVFLFSCNALCHETRMCLTFLTCTLSLLPVRVAECLVASQCCTVSICPPSTQPWRCLLHWGCQARPSIWSSWVLLGKYLAVEWKCSWVPKLLLACQSGWLWVMYVLNKFFLFPSCLNPFSLYHWLPILASFSGLACGLTAFQKIPQWKSCLLVFCLTWAFSPKHPQYASLHIGPRALLFPLLNH